MSFMCCQPSVTTRSLFAGAPKQTWASAALKPDTASTRAARRARVLTRAR